MIGVSLSQVVNHSPSQVVQNKYTCICCRIRFESVELQKAHFKTDWHLYNLKRKVCKLEPIDLDSFKLIQVPQIETTRAHRGQIKTPVQAKAEVDEQDAIEEPDDDDDDDDAWEDVEEDDPSNEDYDDDEVEELLSRVIKPSYCLFCDKKSSSLETSMIHMNLVHGFFIPEERYLIDKEGLMEYLGYKVGAGTTCIWCNKQFNSLHGVRLHMIYKDHCKILYDHATAIEEFKEFYDYSSQVQIQMKPLNQLVRANKKRESREHLKRSLVAKKTTRKFGELTSSYKFMPAYQAKSIKKFDAYKAKIILRTSIANNNTMRGRIRQQNPI